MFKKSTVFNQHRCHSSPRQRTPTNAKPHRNLHAPNSNGLQARSLLGWVSIVPSWECAWLHNQARSVERWRDCLGVWEVEQVARYENFVVGISGAKDQHKWKSTSSRTLSRPAHCVADQCELRKQNWNCSSGGALAMRTAKSRTAKAAERALRIWIKR